MSLLSDLIYDDSMDASYISNDSSQSTISLVQELHVIAMTYHNYTMHPFYDLTIIWNFCLTMDDFSDLACLFFPNLKKEMRTHMDFL